MCQRVRSLQQQIVSTDDYMPMPINSLDEYDKVVNVSWYAPEKPREQLTYVATPIQSLLRSLTYNSFPCVLPFSQMYPLCCIDIRNFLNQIYLFSDDQVQQSSLIDDTLKISLDQLLSENVCQSLVDRLASNFPGQIVQILTNLGHFETACSELQDLLFEARSSKGSGKEIVLGATERFREGKKKAEKRIFELVNSKIDALIEIAEYDWYVLGCWSDIAGGAWIADAELYRMSAVEPTVPSDYMQELTQYLSVNIDSVLLGLPTEIKELVYFDALSHTATKILVSPAYLQTSQSRNERSVGSGRSSGSAGPATGLPVYRLFSLVHHLPSTPLTDVLTCAKALPLDDSVTRISPPAVRTLANDVAHLSDFVNSLNNPILDENLDELRQTVSLMGTENPDDFFDVSLRNRKFGKVNVLNGPTLLEK